MAADRHDEKALELREMIARSRRAVVFTGAGISTESGIADFRSPGGMWSKYQPINFHDFMASEQMRVESWRRLAAVRPVMTGARPNKGHGAVARLVETGKVSAVITQNIDGLHQLSGVCPEKVIELHGNATYAACLECRKRYELDDILASFAETETPPACDACGGIVKTATISFGQEMPQAEMQAAQQESLACDLFISLGSSLVVYPAAAFPEIARRNGAKLAIINREPTGLDRVADLVIHAEIGETLSAAVE